MLEIILVLGQHNEVGAHLVCLAALPSHRQESRNSDTYESTGDLVLSKPKMYRKIEPQLFRFKKQLLTAQGGRNHNI